MCSEGPESLRQTPASQQNKRFKKPVRNTARTIAALGAYNAHQQFELLSPVTSTSMDRSRLGGAKRRRRRHVGVQEHLNNVIIMELVGTVGAVYSDRSSAS